MVPIDCILLRFTVSCRSGKGFLVSRTGIVWLAVTAKMRCCIMLFYYDLLDSTISVMSSLFGIVNSIRPLCILLCIYTFYYVLYVMYSIMRETCISEAEPQSNHTCYKSRLDLIHACRCVETPFFIFPSLMHTSKFPFTLTTCQFTAAAYRKTKFSSPQNKM